MQSERDRNEETFNVDFDAFLPHIGRLTQVTINELLRLSNGDAMEVDQSDNSLKSRVLSSLLTVADCLPVLSSLNMKAFGLIVGVVFELMIRAHNSKSLVGSLLRVSNCRVGQEEFKQLERVYIHLIQNATKDQIELILDHLKLETRADNLVTDDSENNNERLMTSMDCLLLFLTNTAGTA